MSRIRNELDKLPLTKEQKGKLLPTILENSGFLDTRRGCAPGQLHEDSGFFAFDEKVRVLAQRFHADGLTVDAYLTAAVKQPRFLCLSPETVVGHITGIVERFADQGLTTRDYLKAVLKNPSLCTLSPETVGGHITGAVERFADQGLTTRNYLKAALKNPSLFTLSPETVTRNVSGVVEQFADQGLITRDYLKAVLKAPTLLNLTAETLTGHITKVVDRFESHGLTTDDYLQAALKQPSLFYQTPETVVGHITGIVERFADQGLTTRDYLKAALKLPPLFNLSPETVARHINLVFALYDDGVFTLPSTRAGDDHGNTHPHASILAFLLKHPVILALEDNNLSLRQLHKELTGAAPSAMNLLRSRRQTELAVMKHLGHNDPSSPVLSDGYVAGQGQLTTEQAKTFVLRALIREGYIKGGTLER